MDGRDEAGAFRGARATPERHTARPMPRAAPVTTAVRSLDAIDSLTAR